MAFADIAKQHATFATSHVLGQTVECRAFGAATWTSFTARVKPSRDQFGNAIANGIDIAVSKAFLSKANVGKDLFRLPSEKTPGEWWPVYRLTEATELDSSSGMYHLQCIQGD